MPSPRSPLRTLAEALALTDALKGKAKIFLGAANLPRQGAPGRIVIYPRRGPMTSAQYVGQQLDVELEVAAQIWGEDIDHAWDLRARYLRALWEQGIAGGAFWQGVVEEWDEPQDTAEQGQALEVVVNVKLQASTKTDLDRVRVENVSAFVTTSTTADIGAADLEIDVASTYGYPAAGIVWIDDEKISYSARSLTSFVGCARGLGGTVAAAHSSGSTVRVTPSP